MPKRQKIYKVDVTEVERLVALSQVTGDKEAAAAIQTFCTAFSIPLDKSGIKAQVQELEVLAKLLTKSKK